MNWQSLIEDTVYYLYVFRDLDLEKFEYSIIDCYADQLDRKVLEAIDKTLDYLVETFGSPSGLVDYLQSDQPGKSFDRIKHPNLECLRDCESILECLWDALEDEFPYLLAAGLLGAGAGLWELFHNFPCLNTLV